VLPTQHFPEEAFGCSSTHRGIEQEIQRVAGRTQSAIEVHPLPADLDIGLINSPGVVGWLQVRPAPFIYFRCIRLHPAINGRVHDCQAPFSHHLLYISIAERIPKIPANAEQDDFGLVVPPLEWMFHEAAFREGRSSEGIRARSFLQQSRVARVLKSELPWL
jgi:hypothetical protein